MQTEELQGQSVAVEPFARWNENERDLWTWGGGREAGWEWRGRHVEEEEWAQRQECGGVGRTVYARSMESPALRKGGRGSVLCSSRLSEGVHYGNSMLALNVHGNICVPKPVACALPLTEPVACALPLSLAASPHMPVAPWLIRTEVCVCVWVHSVPQTMCRRYVPGHGDAISPS